MPSLQGVRFYFSVKIKHSLEYHTLIRSDLRVVGGKRKNGLLYGCSCQTPQQLSSYTFLLRCKPSQLALAQHQHQLRPSLCLPSTGTGNPPPSILPTLPLPFFAPLLQSCLGSTPFHAVDHRLGLVPRLLLATENINSDLHSFHSFHSELYHFGSFEVLNYRLQKITLHESTAKQG